MSRRLPTEWMIEEACVLVDPEGQRTQASVRIGLPQQVGPEMPGHNHESSCWVRVEELVEDHGRAIGASTLDALVNALELLGERIGDFVASGGKIEDEHDEEAGYEIALGAFFRRGQR